MKLTAEQVKQMWAEFSQGASAAELGTKYGISRQTAYNVLAGKNRKYLELGNGFGPQGVVEERLIDCQGETLRVIRGLLGLTQVQFALQMGKSPGTIGNWETGITAMTIKDRRKLVGWIREKGLEADLIGADRAAPQGGLNV
jgi:DNA-binding XRE family transcriptional regulator